MTRPGAAFNYDSSVRLPARPHVQTVVVEVGRQDSLWGRKCSGIVSKREIGWQLCIWQPVFFWQKITLVKSNGIKIKEQKRAREERRRNLRNLSEERLDRKNERNGARDKTLI